MRSDCELLAACPGDESALAELHDRYAPTLLRFALHRVGDSAAAADITQEAFVHAWHSAHRFQGTGSVRAWLLGIVSNLTRMHHRSQWARHRRETRWQVAHQQDKRSEPPPVARHEQRELQQLVQASLAHLPEHYRDPVWMRFALGIPTSEVAEILERPVDTVRSQIRRGLRRLQVDLRQRGVPLTLVALLRWIAAPTSAQAAEVPPPPSRFQPTLAYDSTHRGSTVASSGPAMMAALAVSLFLAWTSLDLGRQTGWTTSAHQAPSTWVQLCRIATAASGHSIADLTSNAHLPVWSMGDQGPEVRLTDDNNNGPVALLWQPALSTGTWSIQYEVRRLGEGSGVVTGPTVVRPTDSDAGRGRILSGQPWPHSASWQRVDCQLTLATNHSHVVWRVDGTRILEMELPFAAPSIVLAAADGTAVDLRALHLHKR